MFICALLSLLILAGYLTAILLKYKVIPNSLSNTYYMLGKWGFVFTLVMFVIAFLILPPMLEVTNIMFQFVAFFCPAAICFVGAAPNFKEEMEGKVHTIAALISAISGLLWVAFLTKFWWIILICIIICGILAYRTKTIETSKVWWLEMIAFGSVYLALILMLIF